VGCNQNAAENDCEKQSRSQFLSAAFWVCCGFSVDAVLSRASKASKRLMAETRD
jgi:hypothetical protein